MRTPWGKAQTVRAIADGIRVVSTASHGGMKLDAARNRLIPEALRRASGWYEEDCEAAIVVAHFAPEFAAAQSERGEASAEAIDALREQAWGVVRNYFPAGYEVATGRTLAPGESVERDGEQFHERHREDWVVIAALGEADGVHCIATRGGVRGDVEERTFLVAREEYETRSRHGFVIDPARHRRIDDAAEGPGVSG
ncbi:hypothetical protein J2T57_001411 [Natronocella acetinitrilica]|uniref:DUF7007 domain-containing protein n=1 Tax=Natronocella acetinitrilica TaxID=414046 RepID=A0AAE3G3D2_9GAMM|nr:hypothetical protein [Natronocella acetinitrilica]MCP1674309.1 hypothetical protein [Natronocella acetinitrilica]